MTTTQTTLSTQEPPSRATWRQWLGLAVLLLPMLVLATDLTVLFLAMPSISTDLRPGPSQVLWITHVYGFLIGGFLITMGRLGDRVGRRRLLLIGAGAFAVLAVAAAFSTSPEMLIVVRGLLGVAGATLMPSTYSLLRNMFLDDRQRRFAIAVTFSAFAAGGAIGPLLGGLLLEYFWWGSVFLVNVPALAVLLVVGPLLLPEYRETRTNRLDLPSVALSLGAMLLTIYGLQEIAEHGPQASYLLSTLAGVALAVLFIRRQQRLPDPLLDLRLFTNRALSTSVVTLLLTAVGLVGAFFLFTQYLQWVLGYTPLQAGLWTVPYIVVNMVGMLLAPMLSRWWRPVHLIGGGLALTVAGMVVVAVAGGSGLAGVLIGLMIAGLGQGAAMAIASDLIISTAPMERAGSAASMQEVAGEMGTALGIAIGGAVGMLAYRTILTATAPAATPPEAIYSARDGVGGARAAAEDLPAATGAELVEAAQAAFASGLQVASGIGAVLVAAAALIAAVALRHYRRPLQD
jgi:MFS transporter, DHA2 family, multidrug resistance protein